MQKEEPNKTQNVVPLRRPTEVTGSGVAEVLEVREGEAVSLTSIFATRRRSPATASQPPGPPWSAK